MRKARIRKEPKFAAVDEEYSVEPGGARSRRDLFAAAAAVLAITAIVTNALFLQTGPHPAPIFTAKPRPAAAVAPAAAPAPHVAPAAVGLPRPRPAELAAEKPETAPALRSQTDIVIDIQKELARRGFYDGVADGVYGPKTDGAIRDFEQAAGLRLGSEPNEALLRSIQRSPAKFARPASVEAPRPPDPIGEMIAPAKRGRAVQRALSDYGYGQLKPTGTFDRETQEAIEQFERARRLPVTGQITPRLMRELAALTGRPLE